MSMTPELLLKTGIAPALEYLRGHGIPDKLAARRLMLTIALQESGLRHRRQVSRDGTESGPAASLYQFESGSMSGSNEILVNPRLSAIAKKACEDFLVTPTPQGVWEAMRYNDVFASIAARLLIYMLPSMLPERQELGYQQYINAWHPGAPHPERWSANWSAADIIVKANP